MDDSWYREALTAYGLGPECLLKSDQNQAEIQLGGIRGCLWRSPAPPEEQELLVRWENRLGRRGITAVRLLARGGAAWIRIDERNLALLTAWVGNDLERLVSTEDLIVVARFLGRFRRLCSAEDLAAPSPQGLSWAESWDERARRLGLFEQLASERLNPTRFDLIYLEQARYCGHQAQRSAAELAQAGRECQVGVTLGEVDRHRLYRSQSRLGLKTLLGMAAGIPIRDLYRLLARTLPRLDWSQAAAAAILRGYHEEWPLRRAELELLQAGLRFPNDLYRLAHHYFLNRKAWPLRTFLRKQAEIWAREPARNRLVDELPLLLP